VTATTTATRSAGTCLPAQYFEFSQLDPDETTAAGSRTWYVRSQSVGVAFSEIAPGDALRREGQPDEYMVLLPSPDGKATVTAAGERHEVSGRAVVVVPPGDSEVVAHDGGTVVRLFSTEAPDLVERYRNRDVYAEPDPNVAPFVPWPESSAADREQAQLAEWKAESKSQGVLNPLAVEVVDFTLCGMAFQAISAGPLDPFNHAVSFMVECEDQAEIDRYWNALLDGGQPEQCGWLRDRYGLAWQIVPRMLNDYIRDPDRARSKRVNEAMLKMVKLDIAALEAAARG